MNNNSTEAQLLEAAKRAVGSLCQIPFDAVAVNDDGVIDFSRDGASAVVYFWVDAGGDDEPASYRFQATLLHEVIDHDAVYQSINDINADITYGQLCFREDRVVMYYRHFVSSLEPDILSWILSRLLEDADRFDDALKSRLGGHRWLERASDEIDI
jgi:hypothetical protein